MAFSSWNIVIGEEINAAKNAISRDAVWEVISGGSEIVVATGRQVVTFDPAVDSKQEIIEKVSGRSGNLRAPTIKIGDTYYVGYNEELYKQLGTLMS